MTESARFTIGAEVVASDGPCGELRRVVIDPVAKALTHLVVAPRHHHALGRLVPVDFVESDGDPIRLSCTTAEFRSFDDADEVSFAPTDEEAWSYGGGQVYSWPHYELGLVGGMGAGGMGEFGSGHYRATPLDIDRVPLGEVEIRRGDSVHATDGEIGKVKGLVMHPGDRHVTHVLLQEGHFWGEKQVAIPIGSITRMDRGIQVSMTKDEIRELPPVDLASGP